MRAVGATSGSEVRKTAAPCTRVGFDFSSMRRRSRRGMESRRVFCSSSLVPRVQVHIITTMEAPTNIGT